MRTTCSLFSLILLLGFLQPAPAQTLPVTTDSEQARAAFEEGKKLVENLRNDEARAHFDRAIAADPAFAQAHLYRALTSSSWVDFLAHLDHAVERAEAATEGERMFIMSYKANADGDQKRRDELRAQLVEKYPEDTRLVYLHAQSQDDPKDRIKHLKKIVKQDPDYAPAYNILGYAYRETGAYDEAEQAFQTYMRLLPEEPNPYDSLGDLYMKMGRYEDAIANYKKALERSDRFTISQQKIGESLDYLGRHEEARKAYDKLMAMEQDPDGQVGAHMAVSRSYLLEGHYDKAMEHASAAQKMAGEKKLPGVMFIPLSQSWMAQEHGRLDEAAMYHDKAKEAMAAHDYFPEPIKKNVAEALLRNEALIAAHKGEREKALAKAEAFKQKVDADEVDEYHELVGHIYLLDKDYEKAVKHLREADPRGAYSKYYMALAEEGAGNKEKAAGLMQEAANWNQGGLGYALIRAKAHNWVKDKGM